MLTRVVLESPFAGDADGNRRYLARALRDSLARGEAPFASHALYTLALDDGDPIQRAAGFAAGFAWYPVARRTVVYTDRGISPGMRVGIEDAIRAGRPVEYRAIGDP